MHEADQEGHAEKRGAGEEDGGAEERGTSECRGNIPYFIQGASKKLSFVELWSYQSFVTFNIVRWAQKNFYLSYMGQRKL